MSTPGAAGGVFRLPEQLPRKIAMEMILTGDPIDAARAQQLGLVNQVAVAADVVDAALATDDAKDGTRALGEKRRPQWQAR
jgi:enoyl-CoA hydratase/carnithine racemase